MPKTAPFARPGTASACATGVETAVQIRIIVSDASGTESAAEYALDATSDVYYQVHLVVGTSVADPTWRSMLEARKAYPVHAGARRVETDSLHVGYHTLRRDCLQCRF
jgi:hypothetical protein